MVLLAGVDHYVLVFPVDPMIIFSVLLHPKKWFSISFWFALGSFLGAFSIAYFTALWGPQFIDSYFPMLVQSAYWKWAQDFFTTHGVWFILLSSAAPMPQQPTMMISALAAVPLWKIAGMLWLGRLFKFCLIGYLASHAPKKLARLWPLKQELEEFEVPLENHK